MERIQSSEISIDQEILDEHRDNLFEFEWEYIK